MPDRYRRKPTEIVAAQWDGDVGGVAIEEIIAMGVEVDFVDHSPTLRITAGKGGAQGWVDVPEGHWVAKAADDDFYPIDPEVFAATYEPVRPDGTVYSDHAIGLDGRCDACDGPASNVADSTYGDAAGLAAELLSTTDAQVWARRFMEMQRQRAKDTGYVFDDRTEVAFFDEGTMLGWFANAIETGRDHGRDSQRASDVIAEMTKLIRAQDGLLAAYRTGSANRAGKHIDAARAARAQLHELEVAL